MIRLGRKVKYTIGTAYLFWETLRDDDDAPITATSCSASVVDKSTGLDVQTLTVTISSGRLQATMSAGKITTPGEYYIEWDAIYTNGGRRVITDIVAVLPDSTYLASLIPRVRTWLGDVPQNLNKRITQDEQIKMAIEESVRTWLGEDGYTLERSVEGTWEITPEPTANSDDEKRIVLWTAYFILTFWTERIKSESTPMFRVDYDSSAMVIQNRIDVLWEEIKKIDPQAEMPVLSETDIESWGQLSDRLDEALNTWDDI